MKKNLFSNLLFLAAATLFASCQTETPTPPPAPNETVIATSAVQYYGGDVTANYYLIMTDCVLDSEGTFTTAGTVYRIDLYSALPTDPANWRPAVGTYNFAESGEKINTFGKDYSNSTPVIERNGVFVEDQANIAALTGGSVTITHEGTNGFVAVVDIMLSDGTAVKFTAKNFDRDDQSTGESDQTTFMEDVEVELGAAFAESKHHGDLAENGTHCWQIAIQDDNTAFNVATFSTESEIAVGTYTANSKLVAGSFMPGAVDAAKGLIAPTFYYDYITNDYAAIIDGTVTISKEANGDFTFVIDAFDELGNNFTGSWTGPIQGEAAAAPHAVKQNSEVNTQLSTIKKSKLSGSTATNAMLENLRTR